MSEEEPVTTSSAPQSFIIKFWLEEATEGERRAVWRGHITHVPSGERRYVRSLDDILDFISPYLEAIGGEAGGRRTFWAWLNQKFVKR